MKVNRGILPTTILTFGLVLLPLSPTFAAKVTPSLSSSRLSKTVSRSYLPLSSHITLMTENKTEKKLLIKDYLSSTRTVVDKNGKAQTGQSYFPYGSPRIANSNQQTADRLFTGHRKINTISVYATGERFYSPMTGLFLQPDTMEGPNRYSYVSANPISFNDPSGNLMNPGYTPGSGLEDQKSGRNTTPFRTWENKTKARYYASQTKIFETQDPSDYYVTPTSTGAPTPRIVPKGNPPTSLDIYSLAKVSAQINFTPWMDVAKKELGVKGGEDEARIKEYFKEGLGYTMGSGTSWCSAFANWSTSQVDIEGSGRATADSWLKWGKSTEDYRYGAVTIINSLVDKSSWHVAFASKETGTQLVLLGGNQNNAVSNWKINKKDYRIFYRLPIKKSDPANPKYQYF